MAAETPTAHTVQAANPASLQIHEGGLSPIHNPVLPGTPNDQTPGLSPSASHPGLSTSLQTSPPPAVMWDHIRFLPTKADMESFLQRLESGYKEELRGIRDMIQGLQDRTVMLETAQTEQQAQSSSLKHRIDRHEEYIQTLFLLHEDLENRNRRNNIRLRGIPEATGLEDLFHTVKSIFSHFLGSPADLDLELNRVHRALGPRNPDPANPRDVLCRVHFFGAKEKIMGKARQHGPIDFDRATVTLLTDLSKYTLDKRKALKPLLNLLRDHDLTYRWSFPFQLQVRKDGKTHIIRQTRDIPEMLSALRLPALAPLSWPHTYDPPRYRGLMLYDQRHQWERRSHQEPH